MEKIIRLLVAYPNYELSMQYSLEGLEIRVWNKRNNKFIVNKYELAYLSKEVNKTKDCLYNLIVCMIDLLEQEK